MGLGQVVPVVGTLQGFPGVPSRTGGGNPLIVAKQSNAANAANINFGDAVVVMPDATGGTYKQLADWIANGGGYSVSTTTASSTTLTPASLSGLSVGMLVQGAGIAAGTYITAINWSAGTCTISKAATASATVTLYYALFGGVAVREVLSTLGYPYNPATLLTGYYAPGQYVGALVQGGVTVKVPVGTPETGFPVFFRAILNTGTYANGVVGDFESQSDTVNNIYLGKGSSIAEAYFKTGVIDTNDICEITFLTRCAI